MHADDLRRALRRCGDLCNGQRRRVAGKDGVLGHDRLDVAHDLALQLQVFEHRLDDQSGAAQVAIVDDPVDATQDAITLEGRHRAPAHLAAQRLPDGLLGRTDALVIHVLEKDLEPPGGADVGDSAAHQAGAEHGNALDGTRVLLQGILLGRVHAEEKLDELATLRCAHEEAEVL